MPNSHYYDIEPEDETPRDCWLGWDGDVASRKKKPAIFLADGSKQFNKKHKSQ